MTFDTSHHHPASIRKRIIYRLCEHRDVPTLKLGLAMSAKLAREPLCFISSDVVSPEGVLSFSEDNRPWSSITNGCNVK